MWEGEETERARGKNGEAKKDGSIKKQGSSGQGIGSTIQTFSKETNFLCNQEEQAMNLQNIIFLHKSTSIQTEEYFE